MYLAGNEETKSSKQNATPRGLRIGHLHSESVANEIRGRECKKGQVLHTTTARFEVLIQTGHVDSANPKKTLFKIECLAMTDAQITDDLPVIDWWARIEMDT